MYSVCCERNYNYIEEVKQNWTYITTYGSSFSGVFDNVKHAFSRLHLQLVENARMQAQSVVCSAFGFEF